MALPIVISPGDPGHIGHHEEIHELLARLDGQTDFLVGGVYQDLLASLPAAGAGNTGLFRYATDIDALDYSDGSVWHRIFREGRPWVDVTDPLYAAVGDGVADDTAEIQAALTAAAGHEVFVPDGDYVVTIGGSGHALTMPSDTTLRFATGARLLLATNALATYSVILVDGKDHVRVVGGEIVGDLATHSGVLGEGGMGVRIINSTDVIVEDVDVSACWGDGIYVGGTGLTGKSDHVKLIDCRSHGNRRNNCSLTAGDDHQVIRGQYYSANGTLPMAGIDIEPNPGNAELTNVLIDGPEVYDNTGHGVAASQTILKGVVITNVSSHDNGDCGIQAAYVGEGCKIVNNNVYDNADEGINLVGNAAFVTRGMVCVGNHVMRNGREGIRLSSKTESTIVQGNYVFSNGRHGISVEAESNSGILSGNQLYANGTGTDVNYDNIIMGVSANYWIVTGNRTKYDSGAANKTRYGINIANEATTVSNNDFRDGGATANVLKAAGTNAVIRNNLGYVTEVNGTATVANGATTVVVTHGLAQTPSLNDISVTPTNNLGTATKFWISTPTATQFTIHVDADPGVGTATFVWTASIQ